MRMQESDSPYARSSRARRNHADAVDRLNGRLPLVVNDDGDVVAKVAPRPRKQNVLHVFAADVFRRLLSAQQSIVIETNDANARSAHPRFPGEVSERNSISVLIDALSTLPWSCGDAE